MTALALPSVTLTPREQMIALAEMSVKLMQARCTANEKGFTEILAELRKLSTEVDNRQKELLICNPDLMLMIME